MKPSLLRKLSAASVTLLTLSGLTHAHPGHSALDWFTALPHSGHASEYAWGLAALGLAGLVAGACWLVARRS